MLEPIELRVKQVQTFYNSLWPKPPDGFISFWSKKTFKSIALKLDELDSSQIEILLSTGESMDVYHSVCLYDKQPTMGRGRSEDVLAIPCVYLDIDIGTDGHASKTNPPNEEVAMELLSKIGLSPSIIISSGHGLHVYYLLTEPFIIKNEEDRVRANNLTHEFNNKAKALFNNHGFHLDTIGDLVRVLRVPCTINHKIEDNLKPVEVRKMDPTIRYSIEEIKNLDFASTDQSEVQESPEFEDKALKFFSKCNFLKHCFLNQAVISEPEWFNALKILVAHPKRKGLAIVISKDHPEYDETKTLAKLENAAKYASSATCKYIEENVNVIGEDGRHICHSCPHLGKGLSPRTLISNLTASNDDILFLPWDIALSKTSSFLRNYSNQLARYGKETVIPLANFFLRITEEVAKDDGFQVSKNITLEGIFSDGTPIAPFSLTLEEFQGMNWILPKLGAKAIVKQTYGATGYIKAAIQEMSPDFNHLTVYNHIGWRKFKNGYGYLHADGCIGQEDVQVSVNEDTHRYSFMTPTVSHADSLNKSLELLNIAPLKITLPLLCFTFLAPLTSLFKEVGHEPQFMLWLYGRTGSRKTSLAMLFLSHFTQGMTAPSASFKDTGNALEYKAFQAKDSLLVIDDYYPATSRSEREQLMKASQHILRLFGDRISRGRMRPDASLRYGLPPRGVAMITGEDLITGESSRARIFPVEISSVDVNLKELSKAQGAKSLLNEAMHGYISWLAQNVDEVIDFLGKSFIHYRDSLSQEGHHGRSIESVAWLMTSYHSLITYAQSLAIITNEKKKEMIDQAKSIFLDSLAHCQSESVTERPEVIFVTTINSMLESEEYYLSPTRKDLGTIELEHSTRRIGWKDTEFYYFVPDAIYGKLSDYLRLQNRSIPLSMSELWKVLESSELIVTERENRNGRQTVIRTVKVMIDKERKRVLKVRRTKFDEILNQQ